MRIDLTSATAAAVLSEGQGAAQSNQTQRKAAAESTDQAAQPALQEGHTRAADRTSITQSQPADPPKPATSAIHVPPALPAPQVVSVSFDQNRNTVYRFVDEKSGELVRQVPPEEVLRVIRSTEEMLQHSEQKLKVTL